VPKLQTSIDLISCSLGQLPLDQIRVEKAPRQAGWMLYLAIPYTVASFNTWGLHHKARFLAELLFIQEA